MIKQTRTIRRLLPMNCLSVFDHFIGLALEGFIWFCFVKYLNEHFLYRIMLVFYKLSNNLLQDR